MKIPLKITYAICTAIIVAGCQTPLQSVTSRSFSNELTKFDAQFLDARTAIYQSDLLRINNEKNLDEKDGCYSKSTSPVVLILIIDEAGIVRSVLTDVENPKAACFRESFVNFAFPPPPFAPFRHALNMN